MMKIPYAFGLGLLLVSALLLSWGCQDGRPLSPSRVTSLSVSIPVAGEVRSLLAGSGGVGSNQLLYRVDGDGTVPIKGTLGPFSTAFAFGSIDFNVDIPGGGGKKILSVQLNQDGTNLPLALGAATIDIASNAPVTNILVEMGSVTRNCYYTVVPNFSNFEYNFLNDAVTFGGMPIYDISGATSGAPPEHTLYSPTATQKIAYLGNGDMVDFDFVPAAGMFFADSMLAKGGVTVPGDVFCLKLTSMPGHAWIQIIDPGQFNNNGPYFRFRINRTKPYFAYDRTAADVGSACNGAW
jgi:hypothetical protein